MKGKLLDHVVLKDGTQRITLSVDEDFSLTYDQLKESDINVEIKKWHKKKTRDANAYAWVLIDKLAAAMNLTKVEVYQELIRNIGGVSESMCVIDEAVDRICSGWKHNGIGWFTETMPSKIEGCTNIILYFGSSTYDTKQMSALIDAAIEACKLYGIETMPPDQLAALEAMWK